ncbi:MAG TPA: hypothetical protein VGF99_03625, partial [Myxococcota bacterium]
MSSSLLRLLWPAVVGVVAVVTGTIGACTVEPTPRPPASIALQVGTRQSCGVFSGLDYDTSCMSAVSVVARSVPDRRIVLETCIDLEQRRAELGQILRGEPIIDVAGLSTEGVVTFELRGLHDLGDPGADRCTDVANFRHWLLWGESDPVDLGALDVDGGSRLIRMVVDCRDCAFSVDCPAGDCFGCRGIDGAQCLAELPESFCVPGVNFQCGKRCDDDGDCFEGARRCRDDGTCDTAEQTGDTCSPCALVDGVVDGCNEGFTCVGPPG